jgi:plasmid stabilization system protein ParE
VHTLKKDGQIEKLKSLPVLLNRNLELIKENPQIFPKSGHSKEIRHSVISKQVSLYYRIEDQSIHVVSVFDNRQNPNRLK